MKDRPYTATRRTQRQFGRIERVRDQGAPPIGRHDWKCPLCYKWYSKYHGRNQIHLRRCEEKENERLAYEENRRAWLAALPSPVRFNPYPTLNKTSFSRSLSRESPIVGRDEQEEDNPDTFEQSVPDQALLRDDESYSEFNIFKRPSAHILTCLHTICVRRTGYSHPECARR